MFHAGVWALMLVIPAIEAEMAKTAIKATANPVCFPLVLPLLTIDGLLIILFLLQLGMAAILPRLVFKFFPDSPLSSTREVSFSFLVKF